MTTATMTTTAAPPALVLDPPAPTLAELAELEAARYEAMGTAPAGLFARTLRELAFKVRLTEATTAADYEARIEVLENDVRDRWEDCGYEAGRSAGCVQAHPLD